MKGFSMLRKSTQGSLGATWQTLEEQEKKLREIWGLGLDGGGAGYRKRLDRICHFVRELEPDGVSVPDAESEFERYERAFTERSQSAAARESYIQRLEDLRSALEPLARSAGKKAEAFLADVRRWSPILGLPVIYRESPARRAVRQERVEKVLGILGANPAQQEETPLGHLRFIGDLLEQLEAGKADRRRVQDARKRWGEYVEDCAGDWEWAYLQILVRLAGECRQEKPVSTDFCKQVKRAGELLAEAIPIMEKRGFLQYRKQGLYGILAATCLGRARSQPAERLELIERAFTYARHAVEMEPASFRERLVLLDVLSRLGDAEELSAQAEITLNFDSGPETLRTIGASYWDRIVALSGGRARLHLLREAADFFEGALREVESAPFGGGGPLDQVQAHGWAHFWLGRFQFERGKYAEAVSHLRTAGELGFKPLESRVELAWACQVARDRRQADDAFREALAEAHRQSKQGSLVSQAPGEEREIKELEFDAYLGWAFLCAAWDPDRALEKVEEAERLLGVIKAPNQEKQKRQGALDEARGRIHLRKGDLLKAIGELEKAVKESPRCGAYCALGFAYLEQARVYPRAAEKALRSAREAWRLARECHPRGRYRRELQELRRQLQSLDPAGDTPAPKSVPPAPAGAGPVKVPGAAQSPPGSNHSSS